jgi:hypothetical protein
MSLLNLPQQAVFIRILFLEVLTQVVKSSTIIFMFLIQLGQTGFNGPATTIFMLRTK